MGDRHVDGLQIVGLVQQADGVGAERGQALLVDHVEAFQPAVRAIGPLDVEHKGFEQLMRRQGLDKLGQGLQTFMQRAQDRIHLLQMVRQAALGQEQCLALGASADAGAVHVHHDAQLFAGDADREGHALHRQRQIVGVPALGAEEEVVALLQAKQGDWQKTATAVGLEEDGVVGLQAAEFIRRDGG